jgi:two-component system OmpR family response regulator
MVATPNEVPLVLVADNDPHVGQVLVLFLERAGLRVEACGDGRAAEARLARGGIAALVCDLDMPHLAGEVLLERLGDQAPPTIVVSGYVDHRMEERLRAHPRVVEVLRKPFDLPSFAHLVAQAARSEPRGASESAADAAVH